MMAGFDDLIIATVENADDSELSGSDEQIFMYSFASVASAVDFLSQNNNGLAPMSHQKLLAGENKMILRIWDEIIQCSKYGLRSISLSRQ